MGLLQVPPRLSPKLLMGSSWDRGGLGGCLVKLQDSSSAHRLNDALIRMWVSLGSIPALGGDREGEASDSGTVALQGTVSTWLDPSQEAEDGEEEAESLRPGDGLPPCPLGRSQRFQRERGPPEATP